MEEEQRTETSKGNITKVSEERENKFQKVKNLSANHFLQTKYAKKKNFIIKMEQNENENPRVIVALNSE